MSRALATAQHAVAAYGGDSLWRHARAVEASLACGGLLFRWKRRRALPRMAVRADVEEPLVRIDPIDRLGHVGVLEGADVRLERPDGGVVRARASARDVFPFGRRLVAWDSLDLTYFLGYAVWNYLTLPALLLRDDISWRELPGSTLEAEFPPGLPTHCPRQTFRFDPVTGLLLRLDYTAEVFGPFAHAAHLVTAHDICDGVKYPSRRRVVPHERGTALTRIQLIWAEFRDVRVLPRPAAGSTQAG